MDRILIIEDEESILMALADNLRLEGYEVSSALDGEIGLSKATEQQHDLIILDIMLPKLNGFEVCKRLRHERVETPILMLTAKGQEVDKVLGLELGSDDYVTKPYNPRELLARVKALLRRTKPSTNDINAYAFADIQIDFLKYEVHKNKQAIWFTALEFDILRYLIRNKDKVVRRDTLLDEVWGDEVYVHPRTVDRHIADIRKKLEDDSSNPKYILSMLGVGYKFVG